MKTSHRLAVAVSAGLLACAGAWAQSTSYDKSQLAQAAAINGRVLNIDHHLDIPFDFDQGGADATREGAGQFDLAKARRGGVDAAVVALFVPQGPRDAAGYAEAQRKIEQKFDALTGLARRAPEQVVIATSPQAVEAASANGRFAIVLQLLNAYPLGTDLAQLDAWHAKGVRVVSNGDETQITMYVIVEYGTSINVVAESAIDIIRYNVEQETGLRVTKVNIVVEGVRV